MKENKISSHPPLKKTAEDFILEAEKRRRNEYIPHEKIRKSFPWEDPSVRADVYKVFTAKLPEEYILKIKYISDKTHKSQQKIIKEIISENIDKMLEDMNKERENFQ